MNSVRYQHLVIPNLIRPFLTCDDVDAPTDIHRVTNLYLVVSIFLFWYR